MKYVFYFISLFMIFSCSEPKSDQPIGARIANANGMDNMKKIDMLEFTFHAQRDTAQPSSRHWQWHPKTNDVVFITDSSTTKFKRNDTSTKELKMLNARFTNDEYWLLYPLHLGWDKGCEILDSSMQTAPISGKKLHKVTTKYNDKDGYTPGDMYNVYVDDNLRIQEWTFHKSGAVAPSLVTTWENYKDFGGLQLAQEHKSQDGKFRLWFSDIKVSNP